MKQRTTRAAVKELRHASKDERARDAVMEREYSQRCAMLIRKAFELQSKAGRAYRAGKKAEKAAARTRAKEAWSVAGFELWVLCFGDMDNLGKTLSDVALALDGKLRGKRRDALRREVIERARNKYSKPTLMTYYFFKPTPKQIENVLALLATERRLPKALNERAVIRRAKQLGYCL